MAAMSIRGGGDLPLSTEFLGIGRICSLQGNVLVICIFRVGLVRDVCFIKYIHENIQGGSFGIVPITVEGDGESR